MRRTTGLCSAILLAIACWGQVPTHAQRGAAELEELDLPPLLDEGIAQADRERWRDVRRPELLELFRASVYGRASIGRPERQQFLVRVADEAAMGGMATRKDVLVRYAGPDHVGQNTTGKIRLRLFVPNDRKSPAPCFLLICNRDPSNIDPTRAVRSPFWPAERIVERGYAAAAFHYGDVDPDDNDDRFKNGVHAIFDPPRAEGEQRPADAWGAIAAWAWGASRVMDYFETDADIDSARVAVVGHSRGGKAALWAGARDERFAMTVSNNSGCLGAALSRRKRGERVADILGFRNWFCAALSGYADGEGRLPVDQHQLLALIAPRLLYVASASEDAWADPRGEFLACVAASPAWRLYDEPGLVGRRFPGTDKVRHRGRIGYHVRKGKHDMKASDWRSFVDFADRWMSKPPEGAR